MKKNLIYLMSSVILSSLVFTVQAQNCKRFVDFQTKDVNIGGIRIALGLGQGGNTESTKITTIMREASEKVQQLDLMQYNVCNQLKSTKSESIKEKLALQANNIMAKILNIQGAAAEQEAGSPVAEQPQPAVAKPMKSATLQTAEQTEQPAQEIQPATISQPVSTAVNNEDINVEINTPCSGESFYSTADIIRGTGEGWSMDAQMAKRAARTAALEDLAAKIEITVKTLCEDYQISKKNGLDEQFASQLENKTTTIVNQTISGWRVCCEKMTQNQKTKKYTAYMAVEINLKQVLDGTYTQLKADIALKNQLPPKAEFDKKFNEVMGEVEKSNEMVIPEY